jgi:hypothetical protein
MPSGLQCFDASGNLTADIGNRYPRILGSTTLTASMGSGYITNAAFASGDIWFTVASPNGLYSPQLTIDATNNRIAYSPGAPIGAGGQVAVTVYYGVY